MLYITPLHAVERWGGEQVKGEGETRVDRKGGWVRKRKGRERKEKWMNGEVEETGEG